MTPNSSLVPPAATPHDVRLLIGGGETSSVEFKATFKYDLHTRRANRALPAVVAKTMCGFLNRAGGVLLIGVADDGTVLGLGSDLALCQSKNLDGLERAMRASLANALGVEITPHISVSFVDLAGEYVACLSCDTYHRPVFVRDADVDRFYVRDGNQTKPLGVREAHEYIGDRWSVPGGLTEDRVREIALETVRGDLTGTTAPDRGAPGEGARSTVLARGVGDVSRRPFMPADAPPWLEVASRRVLQLFIEPLARSHGWKKLYVISPWISSFESNATMTFQQMLKRVRDDRTTVYVVTRPPEESWHTEAIERLASTRRANIALLPNLHTKLYAARTATGAFAMLGSANFTQASMDTNLELGVRVDGYAGGTKVVSDLEYEAATIYRTPERNLVCRATF